MRGWKTHGWGDWSSFGPVGRWRRFFDSGEVRLALLSLLESGPKHGYELMKDLEARSKGVYRASAGTIYPTLQQLEDEGLVTSETKDGKRVYSLTEAGRKELQREAETVRRIWTRAETWGEWAPCIGPEATMLAGPIAGLIKSAMRSVSRRTGNTEQILKVREILERTKREIEDLEARA
jgi:DNA-binding PadR family transcriptional regulator